MRNKKEGMYARNENKPGRACTGHRDESERDPVQDEKWNAANRQRSKGRRHQREEKISIRHLHSESAGVYRIKGVAKMTTIIVNLLIIAAVFLVAYFAPGDRKGCFWEIMVPIIVTIATTVICIELRSLV